MFSSALICCALQEYIFIEPQILQLGTKGLMMLSTFVFYVLMKEIDFWLKKTPTKYMKSLVADDFYCQAYNLQNYSDEKACKMQLPFIMEVSLSIFKISPTQGRIACWSYLREKDII